jgi:hypothetical protein
MELRFLPKNTWMVARIGTQVENISIHATKEEVLAVCALKNAGDSGSYCALIKMGAQTFKVSNVTSSTDSEPG